MARETPPPAAHEVKARILVVDDDQEMLDLLKFELSMDGYETVQASTGQQALEAVRAGGSSFDLVLLDLFLPDLSGYEICAKIKINPETRSVPVMLITSLKDPKTKVKGLDTGADEFITKPFDRVELLARVRSLIRVSHLHKALEKSLRECAHLQNVKDQLYRLVIHDLRGPVTSVLGAMELLRNEIEAGNKDRSLWLLKKAGRASESILEMVETLVDIERMERGEMSFQKSPIQAPAFLQDVLDQWMPLAETKDLRLSLDPPPAVGFEADPLYLKRAVGNLMTNAIRHSPEGSSIRVGMEDRGKTLELSVEDEGPGIPVEEIDLIFDPTFQAEHRARRHEGSYGLGLALVRLVAEGHGGKAWAEPREPRGSRFILRIKKK